MGAWLTQTVIGIALGRWSPHAGPAVSHFQPTPVVLLVYSPGAGSQGTFPAGSAGVGARPLWVRCNCAGMNDLSVRPSRFLLLAWRAAPIRGLLLPPLGCPLARPLRGAGTGREGLLQRPGRGKSARRVLLQAAQHHRLEVGGQLFLKSPREPS